MPTKASNANFITDSTLIFLYDFSENNSEILFFFHLKESFKSLPTFAMAVTVAFLPLSGAR